jgi:hypothetical protein
MTVDNRTPAEKSGRAERDAAASIAATRQSVAALGMLLAFDTSIEHARSELSTPFSLAANRVIERAPEDPGGRHAVREAGPESELATALMLASAALSAELLRPAG